MPSRRWYRNGLFVGRTEGADRENTPNPQGLAEELSRPEDLRLSWTMRARNWGAVHRLRRTRSRQSTSARQRHGSAVEASTGAGGSSPRMRSRRRRSKITSWLGPAACHCAELPRVRFLGGKRRGRSLHAREPPPRAALGGGMLLVLAGCLSPPRCSPSPPGCRRPGSATRPRRHSRPPRGFCFICSRLIQARISALNPTPKGDYAGTARQPLDCFVHPPLKRCDGKLST